MFNLIVILVCSLIGFLLGGGIGFAFIAGFFPTAWTGLAIGFVVGLFGVFGGNGNFIYIDLD